ncbi:hypothetical protein O4H62_06050 [Hoeflea alexandrii]|nr:hypothetical protein [Hoeflea alexandrii]
MSSAIDYFHRWDISHLGLSTGRRHFFGGFGFWYEALPLMLELLGGTSDGVFTAMLTLFPALAGSSALQLPFADGEKPLRAFSVFYSSSSSRLLYGSILHDRHRNGKPSL